MTNRFRSQGLVVIGAQWGDEGKGRIVDMLAADYDYIARFQGGNNAGHSLHIGDRSLVLHLVPCGIVRPGKICVIGNGVVIDPIVLAKEIKLLAEMGVEVSPDNLKISQNAHIIFEFHKLLDARRESIATNQIGTTKRGIGPAYENKVGRFGIRAQDLLCRQALERKLLYLQQNKILDSWDLSAALECGQMLKPFLCDSGEVLDQAFAAKKRVLFEGAQGALLDIDHGTYPFVTSSNCVAAQASIGTGVGMGRLQDVLMVSKAYCTRVGEGPFYTEAEPDIEKIMREAGSEFGATTGRARRCGWLDLPALKYAARLNGATGLILTKVDVLAFIGTGVKICASYSSKDKADLSFSDVMSLHENGEKVEPKYIDFGQVPKMPEYVNNFSDLPKTIRKICAFIEEELKIPIYAISYGKKRGQEIFITS